jgi:ABC-type transport system involved in cytochrome bd biosynthesis fused ATPase/permease subunit
LNFFFLDFSESLSGGQRKRVNLARAIYKESDIYLFDDCLSSLDVRVANFIMEKCLLGFLKDKTRIIFQNSFYGIQKVDRVILL